MAALAAPPLFPAAVRTAFLLGASAASPVAIFITRTALPITSALRFWPWGLLSTTPPEHDGQSRRYHEGTKIRPWIYSGEGEVLEGNQAGEREHDGAHAPKRPVLTERVLFHPSTLSPAHTPSTPGTFKL